MAWVCQKLEDKDEVKELIINFMKAVKIKVKEERENKKV